MSSSFLGSSNMGSTDKDRFQKELAIRYCLVRGMLPFVEVAVDNARELSQSATVITDIDVLGVWVDHSGRVRRTIFDCKTLKTSPINRALWAAGLKDYVLADDAVLILKKGAPEAHRLSAQTIGVRVFDENQFRQYGEAVDIAFARERNYSSNISAWFAIANFYQKSRELEKLGTRIESEIPLEQSPDKGIRGLIGAVKQKSGEFDPNREEHRSVFFHVLMSFSLLISQAANVLKDIVDFDSDKERFQGLLRLFIWGGYSSYIQRLRMLESFEKRSDSTKPVELDFPEWGAFVELIRMHLDAPHEIFICCLVARELGFRQLSSQDTCKDKALQCKIGSSARVRQFLDAQAEYLVKACSLPREFATSLSDAFDELL